MSIEESMKAVAESNLALANANTALAAATLELVASLKGAKVTATPAAATQPAKTEAATPAAESSEGKKRGRPAKAKTENETPAADASASQEDSSASGSDPFGDGAEGEDPFGDGAAAQPAREYTAEDVRTVVLKVRADKGPDAALAIIKATGADALGKIEKKDYPKVIELCAKQGATL